MIKLTEIGRILKTIGIKGWLKIFISEEYLETFQQANFIFLDMDGSKVPFKVEKITINAQIQLKLKDVDDETKAKKLNDISLWIEEKLVSRKKILKDKSTFGYLAGFSLIDLESGWRGIIHEISIYPEQELAHVRNDKHENLIPLNSEFIQKVDPTKKEVFVRLPEGLLDLDI